MRVAIYARLSRNRDGESTSIPRQVAACRGRFESDWVEVEVFEDDDLSAYKDGVLRPAWERMLVEIEAGHIELVVAYALDRLFRKERDKLALVESGVRFITIRDSMDSNNALLVDILTAVARNESRTISDRILLKHAELRREGRWSGGRRAFGLSDDWSQTVQAEVDLILEAADRVLAGEGLAGVANDWHERGIVTRSGKAWDPSSLKRMLLSPRMIGKRQVGNELSVEAGMPAIMDEDLWRRVQAVLTSPARRLSHGNSVKHLLAGMLTCGRCGSRMHTHTKGSQRRYQCLGLRGGCGKVSINALPVEDQVVRQWFAFTAGPEYADFTARRDRERADRSRDMNAIKATLQAAVTRRNVLTNSYAAGEMEEDDWKSARAIVDAKITMSEEAIRDSGDEHLFRFEDPGLTATVWRMAVEDTEHGLDDRRRLLASLIERIVVHPATSRGRRFDPSRIAITWSATPGLHPGDLIGVKWATASPEVVTPELAAQREQALAELQAKDGASRASDVRVSGR